MTIVECVLSRDQRDEIMKAGPPCHLPSAISHFAN
jgi:hypothetical protein